MTRALTLALIALCTARASAQSDLGAAECLVKTSSRWGAPCDHCERYTDGWKRDFSGTYQLELKNTCRDIIEVKVAVQEKNGTWRTFPVKALPPGETMAAFACEGSGKYMYWARRVNDTEIVLPSDRDIITAYTGR
ncbi:MAG: hypothetical protein ACK4L7_02840 [Flavobacteriales bacterium]